MTPQSPSANPRPLLTLSWRGGYDTSQRVLFCGHNYGFFSCCCVLLWNIQEIQQIGLPLPSRMDFSQGFEPFKNDAQQAAQADIYPLLFQPGEAGTDTALPQLPRINQHGVYRLLPYRRIAPFIERHFRPSARALDIQHRLVRRYNIDPAKTLAVVYRGTDKSTEVRLAPAEHYVALARRLLMLNPTHRLWIQTDEWAVRQAFRRAFGERCFYLHEMPVSSNGKVVHQLDEQALQMDRSEFGVLLVAVNSLLAQCDVVINHTGNMALWLCLFRGHGRNVWQFDDEGRAISPHGLALLYGVGRRFGIKVKRKLLRWLGMLTGSGAGNAS